MNAKLRGLPVAAAMAALLAVPASAETVKIGFIATFSGPNASFGKLMKDAVDLYIKENAKTIAPHTVELIVRDDGGPAPDVARRLAQELITRDKVNVLAGVVFTPNAHAIAPLLAEAKVPLVIMNAGTSVTTTLSPYIVRTSFTLWQSSYPLGKWAVKQGSKRAYTAVTDYGPGHDGEAAFIKGFTEGGGTILRSVRMPIANPDFVPFMQRVKDDNPDMLYVFVPAGPQSTAIMKAFGERGLGAAGIKLVGPGDLTPDDELPNMGDTPLGVVTAHHYSMAHDSPTNKAFVDGLKKEHGANYRASFMSVGAWDGMAAIFHAIKANNGKFDADKFVGSLKGWQSESPRGPIMIDAETRDVVHNEYMRRVEKRDGALYNVEFENLGMTKDPWKQIEGKK
jgi:branched-chain amino acid transport system substrate-binding protein